MFESKNAGADRTHVSTTLEALSKRMSSGPVTVREVLAELGSNASALLVLLLSLPFCAPVTIPGTSTPSGLITAYVAGRFALGLPPWLPEWLLRAKLPPRFFELTFRYASRILRWLEKGIRPRWGWAVDSTRSQRVHAVMIAFSGLLLALPLPPVPPLTNTLPAWVIVVGMLGLIERDGRAVVGAWAIFVLTISYFVAILLLGNELVQWLKGLWDRLVS